MAGSVPLGSRARGVANPNSGEVVTRAKGYNLKPQIFPLSLLIIPVFAP